MDHLNCSDRGQILSVVAPLDTECHSATAVSDIDIGYRAKRQHGVYYTPSEVADFLVNWAIRSKHDSVLEPSFGGCAFLGASVSRLRRLGCVEPEQQLCGFDIDPQAFVHLAQLDSRLCATDSRFTLGDFLSASPARLPGGKVDVVVGNPPFVPYRRMNAAQRKSVADWSRVNTSVAARDSSLWAYFLQHALRFIKSGGRMAWILPSSLLFVEYGHALRDLIQQHFTNTIYVDLQQQLFIDSGTRERTMLVFSEGFSDSPLEKSKATTLNFSRFREVTDHFSRAQGLAAIEKRTRQPETPAERSAQLIAEVLSTTPYVSLGDISSILIGDVIGDTSYFVKSQLAWLALGVKDCELLPIVTKSSQVSGLEVTRSNIDQLIERGEKCMLLRVDPANPSTEAANYLSTYPRASRLANATFARRSVWFMSSYDNSADLFFPSLSTLGTRIIVNSGRVACANSLYRIHLKPEWRTARFAIALYGATSFVQLMAELVGGGMGEGALKLNPSHLKQMPMIAPLHRSGSHTYDIFRKVDRMIANGQQEEAQKVADAWLAPVLGTKTLDQMSTLLGTLRGRRRDYRLQF